MSKASGVRSISTRCSKNGVTRSRMSGRGLRIGVIEEPPRSDSRHGNHRVRLLGRCLDGRETRLVVGLWKTGPCVLISIVDVKARGKRS